MTSALYEPLDRGRLEIRLIHVSPADSLSDDLICELQTVSLYDEPFYEAISYAWGDIQQQQTVVVNSSTHLVSQNLADALVHFRQADRPKILWADQLCINQNDHIERSHQVRLMARIYRQADCVRVWLGRAGPHNDELMRILSGEVEFLRQDSSRSAQTKWSPNYFSLLTILLTRPWWTRLWVLQEVVLAQEAYLQCGFQSVPLRSLVKTSEMLKNGSHFRDEPRTGQDLDRRRFLTTLARRLEILRILESLKEQSESSDELHASQPALFTGDISDDGWFYENFLQILARCRGYFASDPRDKIFALLGLLPERIIAEINPNYADSVERVFGNITMLILKYTKSLTVLSFAAGFEGRGNGPSWAASFGDYKGPTEELQWRMKMQQHELFDVSDGTESEINVLNDNLLGFHGVQTDSVQHVTSAVPRGRPTSMKSLVNTLEQWSADILNALRKLGFADETVLSNWDSSPLSKLYRRVFVTTLVGGTIPLAGSSSVRLVRPSDFDDNQHPIWSQFFETADPTILHTEAVGEDSLSNHLIKNLHGRSMFVTGNGLLGLGPGEAREGDRIFVLSGGRFPFMLGPTSFRDDHFVLIGEAYVHGLMQGLSRFLSDLKNGSLVTTFSGHPARLPHYLSQLNHWQEVFIGG